MFGNCLLHSKQAIFDKSINLDSSTLEFWGFLRSGWDESGSVSESLSSPYDTKVVFVAKINKISNQSKLFNTRKAKMSKLNINWSSFKFY